MDNRADGSFGVLWLNAFHSSRDMKEQDWNFLKCRFLAYVLGPAAAPRQPPSSSFSNNASPEAISSHFEDAEYRSLRNIEHRPTLNKPSRSRIGKRGHCASRVSVLAFSGSHE